MLSAELLPLAQEVAAAAGVAAKTVFASVGSKAEVFNQVVDMGAEDSGYTRTVAAVLTTRTLADAVKVVAHGTRIGNEGGSTVLEAIRKALPVQADGEALWLANANRDLSPREDGPRRERGGKH